MRAWEFMINENWSRSPRMTQEHLRRMTKIEKERQASFERRRPLLARMYANEDPVEAELRQLDLRKQRLELQQMEAEIAQIEAETENEKIKSESDGMTAVRSMALSALKK